MNFIYVLVTAFSVVPLNKINEASTMTTAGRAFKTQIECEKIKEDYYKKVIDSFTSAKPFAGGVACIKVHPLVSK